MQADIKQYDLFLSYHYGDDEFVQLLASRLTDLGMRVWFDKWELVPGQTWTSQLERAIAQSVAIGICIGSQGIEKRNNKELDVALTLAKQGHASVIIPILLPGANIVDAPASLIEREFADFRDGISSVKGVGKILSAIYSHITLDRNIIAIALHNLATVAQDQGEIDEARQLYNESLEIKEKLGNQQGIAITLHQLGNIAYLQGNLDEARQLYNQSLDIAKKLNIQSSIASTLHQLGRLAQDQGEIDEARQLYNQSLEIEMKLNNQSGIASTLHQLGVIAQDQGEIDEARQLYNQSLDIAKKLNIQSSIASTLHQLGWLAQSQGEIQEARRLYSKSLKIAIKLGDQNGIASTLGQLGYLVEGEGAYVEAARLLHESLSIFEKLKSPKAEIARRSLERVENELK